MKRYAITPLLVFLIASRAVADPPFRANAKRMEERITVLSQFGKNPEGGVSGFVNFVFRRAFVVARPLQNKDVHFCSVRISRAPKP